MHNMWLKVFNFKCAISLDFNLSDSRRRCLGRLLAGGKAASGARFGTFSAFALNPKKCAWRRTPFAPNETLTGFAFFLWGGVSDAAPAWAGLGFATRLAGFLVAVGIWATLLGVCRAPSFFLQRKSLSEVLKPSPVGVVCADVEKIKRKALKRPLKVWFAFLRACATRQPERQLYHDFIVFLISTLRAHFPFAKFINVNVSQLIGIWAWGASFLAQTVCVASTRAWPGSEKEYANVLLGFGPASRMNTRMFYTGLARFRE